MSNEQGPGTDRAPVKTNGKHEVRAILTAAYEESWVLTEREHITEARAERLMLWMALGLRGYRHDDHPAVWSRERVCRLERRRRMGAA